MARTAEVKRDARIGEAEARRDAQIREAIAEEQRMAARFLNDTEIAKAQRDFELKKAAYDVEVQTKVSRQLRRVCYGACAFREQFFVIKISLAESRGRNGLRVASGEN